MFARVLVRSGSVDMEEDRTEAVDSDGGARSCDSFRTTARGSGVSNATDDDAIEDSRRM